ncbi:MULTISPECIES: PEP-CTERM sorting domain-containing protein [Roseateles]|uniref:PEP-CTERM sorting domain-containing protein n=1 Tax=Roseateles flavus TaxID=3149041 RepID=A0ABV0GKM7_9BURK|nr:PEP-CTERM sorting domain-containing protein [Pelomonas sp. BJYL3]
MKHKPMRTWAVLPTLLLGLAGAAQAALVGSTSLVSFNTASAGLGSQSLVDFESPPPGGFSVSGSTAVGLAPSVRNQAGLWNPSGTHFLGVDDAGNLDQFSSGDTLTFTFSSALRAFGLYVVAGGDVIEGDLTLSIGGTVLSNGPQSGALTDGAGSYAYFMGFVAGDAGDAFNSITLKSNGDFFFVFDVDDLRFTPAGKASDVPEPQALSLALLAACAAGAASRRKALKR